MTDLIARGVCLTLAALFVWACCLFVYLCA